MSKWWLFFHLAGVLGLLLSHGTSVAVAFRLRKERDPARIKVLLELSYFWVGIVHLFMFAVIVTGVVMGFLGRWWGAWWLWASIGVLVGLWVAMSILGTRFYDRLRRGVGADPFYGAKKAAPSAPVSQEELEALLSSPRPVLLAVLGIGGLLLILWLMMFKPF